MLLPNRHGSSNEYRYGFNGKEKDDEVKGEGVHYDYGARMLDPRIGRWFAVDPARQMYPSSSPYVFSLCTPIQSKDPDGNVVIFINGQHGGSGGQAQYWEGYDDDVMSKLGDENARYVDGAMGGWKNTISTLFFAPTSFLTTLKVSNLRAKARIETGKKQGLADAESIYNNLSEGETVKIVTHSMGTAFSRGYVEGLQQWAEENNKIIEIEYQLDVNSFQGADLEVSNGVPTDNKTGGLDGGGTISIPVNKMIDINGEINAKISPFNQGELSVPGVAPVPRGNDITDETDSNKGHAIGKMSTSKIPYLGNQGTKKKTIEQGNDNQGL